MVAEACLSGYTGTVGGNMCSHLCLHPTPKLLI